MQDIRLRSLILLVIISIVLTIDYLSKKSIEALDQTIILNSFITLYKVNNPGVAFSILDTLDNRGLFILNLIIISILIIVMRELYLNVKKSLLYTIGLSMIFAGGLGNLIDRYDNYSVTDFISIHIGNIYFPAIFNVADISITFGALLVFFHYITEKNESN